MHSLLNERGLTRYYALAGDQVVPVASAEAPQSHAWLEPLLEGAQAGEAPVCQLQLDVQGIHCAACVWLMNETFRQKPGAGQIVVNPTLGTVQLAWKRGELDLTSWVRDVERFGYQFGPPRKERRRTRSDLAVRLGVSAAITINVMLFSVSFYFGLGVGDPELFSLFTWLSFGLSSVTVAVGGWPFFVAALRGLRSRLLHLDLPIALGIVLVYAMSVVQLVTSGGRGDLAYFDTLNTFITLMLLGRFLQERLIERNRRFLLDDDGADGLMVRRVAGDRVETVRAPKLVRGDVLVLAPGDLVPVASVLQDPEATLRTDWMTGEAAPRRVQRGDVVPAGSFNAGPGAFQVLASEPFTDSPLVALLRQSAPRSQRGAQHRRLWDRVAKRWVVTVLGVAGLGFAAWLPRGTDAAVNVAVALLVITCPCAIGIAIPLAYELALSRLRRQGFYVRGEDLLDRLTDVRRVIFDKTGTLTLGRLELADPEAAAALDPTARDVAYNLAVRSSHPVSVALARALLSHGARYDAHAHTREAPGQGVEWARPDGVWRLGRADWALGPGQARRALGGLLYLTGFVMMMWNLAKTIWPAKATNTSVEVTIAAPAEPIPGDSVVGVITGRPLWFSVLALGFLAAFFLVDSTLAAVGLAIATVVIGEVAYLVTRRAQQQGASSWFAIIERRPLAFTVLSLLAILVGGVSELLPTILVKQAVPASGAPQKPYTALELQGRDVYLREGCYLCHSQMVRPMLPEYLRYGEASRAEEFIYDHPFQWGSKRTGPDLHRIGGRYPNLWHYTHLMDPRSTSPGSNMPTYQWLADGRIDEKLAPKKFELMKTLGVPYTAEDIAQAETSQRRQAQTIVADLAKQGVTVEWNSEMVALIGYLQRLGRDQGVALSDDVVKTAAAGGGN